MPAVPIIMAAATYTGATAAIGTAIAGVVGATVGVAAATAIGAAAISGGISLIQGGDAGDVLKSAVVGGVASYVGGQVAASVGSSVANSAMAQGMGSLGNSMAAVAGGAAGGATQGTIGALAYGKDPFEALIAGGLTGGLSAGVMEIVNSATSNIQGFDTKDPTTGKVVKGSLSDPAQRAIKVTLAETLQGADPQQAALAASMEYAGDIIGETVKDKLVDKKSTVTTSYERAKAASDSLDEMLAEQKRIADETNALAESVNSARDSIQAKIDSYNNDPDKTQSKLDAVNEEVNAFNSMYTREVAKIDENKAAYNALNEKTPELQDEFSAHLDAYKASQEEFMLAEEQNAKIIRQELTNVVDAQDAYKASTGQELDKTQLASLYTQGEGDIKAAVARSLGYANKDEFESAILARELPSDAIAGLQARPGEVSGNLEREILEDGSTVYHRTFTGKTSDGKDYSYVASYDPNSEQKLSYVIPEGVSKDLPIGEAIPDVVSSAQRPTFGTTVAAPEDYQKAASLAYNNYINAQILASATNTPEAQASLQKARMDAELAQRIADDQAKLGAPPAAGTIGVPNELGQIEPPGETIPSAPQPVHTGPAIGDYADLIGDISSDLAKYGLASAAAGQQANQSGLPTNQQGNQQGQVGGLQPANQQVTYDAPKPYVETPSFTLNPVPQVAQAAKIDPFSQRFFRIGGLAAIKRN